MGLETGTFVDDLIITNPPGSDSKSQGDDHLRLIKNVLRNTFKRASKTFSFPGTVSKSTNYTAVSTDDNLAILFSTGAGDLVLTLPSLAAADAGWTLYVTKTTTDSNAVQIAPPSGTINAFSFINRSVEFLTTRLLWTGSMWVATRQFGVPIGTILPLYGASPPRGTFLCDGSSYSSTRNPELFATMGGTTLPDMRGRVPVGMDNLGGLAANRVTAGGSGITATSIGAVGGNETHTLTLAQLAAHNHGTTEGAHNHGLTDLGHTHVSPTLNDPQHSHGVSGGTQGGTIAGSVQAGGTSAPATSSTISINNASTGITLSANTGSNNTTGYVVQSATTGLTINNAGSGNAHNNMPPSYVLGYVIVAE